MNATKDQIRAINAIIAKAGQMENKAAIVFEATGGRTTHSSELTAQEAQGVLQSLNRQTSGLNPSLRMINKLFAMANEIGYIPITCMVTHKGIVRKKEYSHLHAWVEKYGYLKKPLKEYSHAELPTLVSQFEFGPYKDYLSRK